MGEISSGEEPKEADKVAEEGQMAEAEGLATALGAWVDSLGAPSRRAGCWTAKAHWAQLSKGPSGAGCWTAKAHRAQLSKGSSGDPPGWYSGASPAMRAN